MKGLLIALKNALCSDLRTQFYSQTIPFCCMQIMMESMESI